jgi:hypothetical protein
MYNVVGTVKNFLHVDPGKPLAPRAGAGQGRSREAGRLSKTLDAA